MVLEASAEGPDWTPGAHVAWVPSRLFTAPNYARAFGNPRGPTRPVITPYLQGILFAALIVFLFGCRFLRRHFYPLILKA